MFDFNFRFVIMSSSILLDTLFYGKLTIVPWNFFHFNVISGLSSHYGTHSWHWYLTQGLPVTLGIHSVPFIYGIYANFSRYSRILLPCLWIVLIHRLVLLCCA